MTPSEVMSKLMSDPELAAAMNKAQCAEGHLRGPRQPDGGLQVPGRSGT